jgi:hypothetical protein
VVHGEIQKAVAILVVMRRFCIVLGVPRACADFCDPTAVFRLKKKWWNNPNLGRLNENKARSRGFTNNYRFKEHGFGPHPQATLSI